MLDLRGFDQDIYWLDRFGTPHKLAEMDVDYLANVARASATVRDGYDL